MVNSEGTVVDAQNMQSKTTTTHQVLINRIINAVKSQVTYSKKPDAPMITQYYVVKIHQ